MAVNRAISYFSSPVCRLTHGQIMGTSISGIGLIIFDQLGLA